MVEDNEFRYFFVNNPKKNKEVSDKKNEPIIEATLVESEDEEEEEQIFTRKTRLKTINEKTHDFENEDEDLSD